MAVMGRDGKFLLDKGGNQEGEGGGGGGGGGGGVGFIMEGWEIFKVSFHSWWRGANLPIL